MQPRDPPPVCSEYPKPCEQEMLARWLPTPARMDCSSETASTMQRATILRLICQKLCRKRFSSGRSRRKTALSAVV